MHVGSPADAHALQGLHVRAVLAAIDRKTTFTSLDDAALEFVP